MEASRPTYWGVWGGGCPPGNKLEFVFSQPRAIRGLYGKSWELNLLKPETNLCWFTLTYNNLHKFACNLHPICQTNDQKYLK
jgi:hypothetical protein